MAYGNRRRAAALSSFPRKRESRQCCLIMPQYWQATAGFPLTREGR